MNVLCMHGGTIDRGGRGRAGSTAPRLAGDFMMSGGTGCETTNDDDGSGWIAVKEGGITERVGSLAEWNINVNHFFKKNLFFLSLPHKCACLIVEVAACRHRFDQ
ncbi:MAG: hypothetical protein K9N23_12285 [Akkermansiaceae bacterium]|nr:hypothetical protein [Akkermansiaceae bacterium]